jgi:hypothetical protein
LYIKYKIFPITKYHTLEQEIVIGKTVQVVLVFLAKFQTWLILFTRGTC